VPENNVPPSASAGAMLTNATASVNAMAHLIAGAIALFTLGCKIDFLFLWKFSSS